MCINCIIDDNINAAKNFANVRKIQKKIKKLISNKDPEFKQALIDNCDNKLIKFIDMNKRYINFRTTKKFRDRYENEQSELFNYINTLLTKSLDNIGIEINTIFISIMTDINIDDNKIIIEFSH